MRKLLVKIFCFVILCLGLSSCDSLVLVSDPYYVPEYHYYYHPTPVYHPMPPQRLHHINPPRPSKPQGNPGRPHRR